VSDDDNAGDIRRPAGRPLKVDGPKFPQQEVDRALVFGELVDPGDGSGPTVVFPSYRELGMRYGVSHSVIAEYARKHNCIRRREHTQARLEARTDQKLIELRATAMAMSKDDTLRIIDSYILGFEKAVADGRVRFENPSDFNTMVRLKQFIEGGPDSRQEIHATLSLESLQARHKEMLQSAQTTTPAERGDREPVPRARRNQLDPAVQWAPPEEGAALADDEGLSAKAEDEAPGEEAEGDDREPRNDRDELRGDEQVADDERPDDAEQPGDAGPRADAEQLIADASPHADDWRGDDQPDDGQFSEDEQPDDNQSGADDQSGANHQSGAGDQSGDDDQSSHDDQLVDNHQPNDTLSESEI
jgi:hypothetical protein